MIRKTILRIGFCVIAMFTFSRGYAVDKCTQVSLERTNQTGTVPGIVLNFYCKWSGADGASWTAYEGPYVLYRDGIYIASINEGHGYHDLDVKTGSKYVYSVSAHGCSSSATIQCPRNFEVSVDKSEVELGGEDDSVVIAVSAVKEEWESYTSTDGKIEYHIVSSSASWTVASDSDWCAAEKNASGTALTVSAWRNSTGYPREAIITVFVNQYQRRQIVVTQSALPSDVVYVTTTDGKDIAVPLEWFGRYTNFATYFGNDLQAALLKPDGKTDGDGNTLYVWQDYVAGTNPTNPNDLFQVGIAFTNGMPYVSWTPNLNTNGEVRVYTVMGKTNLTDAEWVCPTNAAHRFFKVKVELP